MAVGLVVETVVPVVVVAHYCPFPHRCVPAHIQVVAVPFVAAEPLVAPSGPCSVLTLLPSHSFRQADQTSFVHQPEKLPQLVEHFAFEPAAVAT